MIVVLVTMRFDPGAFAEVKKLAVEMAASTRAERGCRLYNFGVDLEQAATLHLSEWWDSEDALASHFATPHMAEFSEALRAIGVLDSHMKRFEVSSERDLRAPRA